MINVFDLETDGLLRQCTTIHSLVIKNEEEVVSCASNSAYTTIDSGIEYLSRSSLLVGHNIICYDLPVLKKLKRFNPSIKLFDTLNASRLIFTNLFEDDARSRYGKVPKNLWGSHSLKAWGFRLGENKIEIETDWKEWTPEMQTYCEQDVNLTYRLYNYFKSLNYSETALDLEMDFQKVIHEQERGGILFDTIKAKELAAKIKGELVEQEATIHRVIPLHIKRGRIKTPKRDNKTLGRKKGASYSELSISPINPRSRPQVIDYFTRKYEWEPTVFTKSGNPSLSGKVLRETGFIEAKPIADYLDSSKILGYVSDGEAAWLKKVQPDGRIYGRVITNGAVSGRCTHSGPNLAQVPSTRSKYGKECRALFHSGHGVMVGADASGIELRCLAHYLYNYDGGKYAKEASEGDIHTTNQEAAGLDSRDTAKTFIYAFNYGAGDDKLGSIVTGSVSSNNYRIGKELRARFLSKLPAIGKLLSDIRWAVKQRGTLRGLDGRRLHIRSSHLALNTLLQSAGAILMKKANIIFWENFPFKECQQVISCHDEFEIVTNRPDDAEAIGKRMVDSIRLAGEAFNFKIPLTGEYHVGKNWSDVH